MLKELVLPNHTRELFIYRIVNRYVKYNNLKIFAPTPECLYESQFLYNEVYKEAIENEILTEAEIINMMLDTGEWTDDDDEQLKKVLPKHIEYFQKEIFYNIDNRKQVNQISIYLNKAKDEIVRLINKKNVYNHFSAEGLAIFAKLQYIIEHSTFEGNEHCDWEKYDIRDVISYWYNLSIDDTVMRYLARNSPWTDIWYTSKKANGLFKCSGSELSDEQSRIIRWSSLYENIESFPDAPKDKVVECDDALDGWLAIKRDEKDKERHLDEAERIAGKNKNAGEVFIVADSQQRAEEIYGLNDPSSRAIVKNRIEVVKKLGEAKDVDFGDVQRNLQIQQTQNAMRK